jgi:hypothetical protein
VAHFSHAFVSSTAHSGNKQQQLQQVNMKLTASALRLTVQAPAHPL